MRVKHIIQLTYYTEKTEIALHRTKMHDNNNRVFIAIINIKCQLVLLCCHKKHFRIIFTILSLNTTQYTSTGGNGGRMTFNVSHYNRYAYDIRRGLWPLNPPAYTQLVAYNFLYVNEAQMKYRFGFKNIHVGRTRIVYDKNDGIINTLFVFSRPRRLYLAYGWSVDTQPTKTWTLTSRYRIVVMSSRSQRSENRPVVSAACASLQNGARIALTFFCGTRKSAADRRLRQIVSTETSHSVTTDREKARNTYPNTRPKSSSRHDNRQVGIRVRPYERLSTARPDDDNKLLTDARDRNIIHNITHVIPVRPVHRPPELHN